MDDSYDERPGVITDVSALKALGHPIRLALLDALLDGPLTATEAGERLGETAASCSFHLRQLERYGFVEIASIGPGRKRAWRRLKLNWSLPVQSSGDNTLEAIQHVQSVILDRYFSQIRQALLDLPNKAVSWREAALTTQSVFFITAEELAEYSKAFSDFNTEFAQRWGERAKRSESRPADSRRVEILTFGVPIESSGASPQVHDSREALPVPPPSEVDHT